MSQPSSKQGCFGQSIADCLGFFKRSGSNTQTKQCNSDTKFSHLNDQSPRKEMGNSDDFCCISCCSLKKKSIDYQEPHKTVVKQPQKVLKPEQITAFNDPTKPSQKTDVRDIVGVTNIDNINIDYSSYLTNNKDEGLVKSNYVESINSPSAKNNNAKITQNSDKNISVNTNNSCYTAAHETLKSVTSEAIAQNNNKQCNADELNEKRGEQETYNVQHETLNTESNIAQSELDMTVPSTVCEKPPQIDQKSDFILPQVNGSLNNQDTDEHDTTFFRHLTSSETNKLQKLCKSWEETMQAEQNIPEEVQNEIRSVIGQTGLVISERFAQFLTLVDRAEGVTTSEDEENLKPITITDLQGFWDMIYFQVEDVESKFQRLQVAKSMGWTLEQSKVVKKPTRPTNKKKTTNNRTKAAKPVSEAEKARKEAARKRILEARRNMALRNKEINKTVDQTDSVLIM